MMKVFTPHYFVPMKSVYCIPFLSQCCYFFVLLGEFSLHNFSLSASYMNEIHNFVCSDGGSKNTQYCTEKQDSIGQA